MADGPDVILLVKGFAVGFAIAAPLGPTAVLCIRRTLTLGRLFGLATGLGATLADTLLGTVAVFGLTLIQPVLQRQGHWLSLCGGVLLIVLGLLEWRSRRSAPAGTGPGGSSLFGSFFSTLLLTLANPQTVLSFAAVMAGLGVTGEGPGHLGDRQGALAVLQFIAGVMAGSLAWWSILTVGIGLVRHRLGAGTLLWLNRLSGTALAAFGVYVLVFAFY
jgi:threonine/homoserine/homoserine lactone efflux protein